MNRQENLLRLLARMNGVVVNYRNATGFKQQVPASTLLQVLQALEVPVAVLADVPDAIRECRSAHWQRRLSPVVVAWHGETGFLQIRLPAGKAGEFAECVIKMENGQTLRWAVNLRALPLLREAVVEGCRYEVRCLELPSGLPWGYHRLFLAAGDKTWETLLIYAPRTVYVPGKERRWGVFLPLYALHSGHSWGTGDFTDLEALLKWVGELGGSAVGTLPLLPTFLLEGFYDPSPYSPVTRLFWNEFYLDVTRVPEFSASEAAQNIWSAASFQQQLEDLRTAPLVEYYRVMEQKRKVLAAMARYIYTSSSPRREAFESWVEKKPLARDYARFMAAVEKHRTSWQEWPESMRRGNIWSGDCDSETELYHLYVRWVTNEQFDHLFATGKRQGSGLYLDFPLGVNAAGFDVWREQQIFVPQFSCGAPPDPFHERGQKWGFPPLHPEKIRTLGYRYFIDCLRHHLRYASVLRLDHVMGFHRLYWVPSWSDAREGTYVRYRAEELYAILAVESHRHQCMLVGEDLGTVPAYVREDMDRFKMSRMYILPFEQRNSGQVLAPVPDNALASLNTHDMAPFASFWLEKGKNGGYDLAKFLFDRGWLDRPRIDMPGVLAGCLKYLAASRASYVQVNLEDLWLEMAPQNVPGAGDVYPNWRRKARYDQESLCKLPVVVNLLREVHRLRDKAGNQFL